jgi:hypothetical protein
MPSSIATGFSSWSEGKKKNGFSQINRCNFFLMALAKAVRRIEGFLLFG